MTDAGSLEGILDFRGDMGNSSSFLLDWVFRGGGAGAAYHLLESKMKARRAEDNAR